MIKLIRIRDYEVGLLFRNGEFKRVLNSGWHCILDPLFKAQVDMESLRDPWIVHDKLDLIIKSNALNDRAIVIDLPDHERALVWIDGRFHQILSGGQYALWTGFRDIKVERIDTREVRFVHPALKVITAAPLASRFLDICTVPRDHVGVLYVDGLFVDTLRPGQYAFWKGEAEAKVVMVDARESMVDVGGQEIMTSDKVTLRLNAVVTYRVEDALKAVAATDDVRQSLYRETQLVLRAVVGTRDLDTLLAEKDSVTNEIENAIRVQAEALGLKVASIGIRDIILPGEMKELMNKVTEAKKAAEANCIVRREETAAIRSQANTAKLLADNPTLMRLRELEVLEKIASGGSLNVVLGEKGLADRVVNLL